MPIYAITPSMLPEQGPKHAEGPKHADHANITKVPVFAIPSAFEEEKQQQNTEEAASTKAPKCESRSCYGSSNGQRPRAQMVHVVLFDDAYDEIDEMEYAVCSVCNRACKKRSQGGRLVKRFHITVDWLKQQNPKPSNSDPKFFEMY
jgi:hypothetical protein